MTIHDGADHCPKCQRVILRDGKHIATGKTECEPTELEEIASAQDAKIMALIARVDELIARAEDMEHTLRDMAEAHRETDNRLANIEQKADDAIGRTETLEHDLDEESRRINELEGA